MTKIPQRQISRITAPFTPKKTWLSYFQDNTLKVFWSLMLFLGGVFALMYFAHIEFLPEIDLPNAPALLSSVALLGLFVILVLGVLFVFPGWILHQLTQAELFATFNGPPKPTCINTTLHASASAAFIVALLYVPILREIPDYYIPIFLCALFVGVFLGVAQAHLKKSRQGLVNGELHQFLTLLTLISIWLVTGALQLLLFSSAYQGADDDDLLPDLVRNTFRVCG